MRTGSTKKVSLPMSHQLCKDMGRCCNNSVIKTTFSSEQESVNLSQTDSEHSSQTSIQGTQGHYFEEEEVNDSDGFDKNFKYLLKHSVINKIQVISSSIKLAQSHIKKESRNRTNDKNNKSFYQKCVIEPDNNYKKFWDLKLFFIIIFVSTYIMYLDIFDQEVTQQDWYIYLQNYITITFLLDIVLQFFVAYRNKFNIIIRQPSKIVGNYLKGLFVLDIIASIPFEFIGEIIKIMKIPKMFKILKNLKLFKLTQFKRIPIIKNLINNLDSTMLRFILMMMLVVLFIHLSGCIFFSIAMMQDFQPDTWIYQQGLVNEEPYLQYMNSVYWSTQTITTVGFGDFVLLNDYEKMYANVWIIIGAAFYSFLISNLQSLAQNKVTAENDEFSLSKLNQFSLDINLPPELLQKMKSYFHTASSEFGYQTKINNGLDLTKLPYTLKAQLMIMFHHKIISRLHLFIFQPIDCIMQILPHLTPICFDNGEIIYTQGEQSEEIYFIFKGSVTLKNNQGNKIITYQENQNFGGIELIHNLSHRKYTSVASSNVWLIYLNKKQFNQIMFQYKSIADIFKREVSQQQKEINSSLEKLEQIHTQKITVLHMGIQAKKKQNENDTSLSNDCYKHEYQAINQKFQIKKETLAKRVRQEKINNGFGLLIKKFQKIYKQFSDQDLQIFEEIQLDENKVDCYKKLQTKILKDFKNIKEQNIKIKHKYLTKLFDRKQKIKEYDNMISENVDKIEQLQEILKEKLK